MSKYGRIKIKGWKGEHDEAGAVLETASGMKISTPSEWEFRHLQDRVERYQEYRAFTELIVDRWNAHEDAENAAEAFAKTSVYEDGLGVFLATRKEG